MQDVLPGFEHSKKQMIAIAQSRPLEEKVAQAIELLRMYESNALGMSPDGYWLAFSGGKDSIVIKELARMSGVQFKSVYNVTTIDPPELIRYIKKYHAEVEWNRPRVPMMVRMVEKSNGPPTRLARWCCEEYKEMAGGGYTKIIGVRAAESPRRADNWQLFSEHRKRFGWMLCPILYWTDDDVWTFIRQQELPYCELYDEEHGGFKRLGCVGCPLAGPAQMKRDFERWPGFEKGWKLATKKFWEKWHGVPTLKGKRRWFEDAGSWEMLWKWWITGKKIEGESEDCQMSLMWSSGNASNDEEEQP